jgi:hypothetical protein
MPRAFDLHESLQALDTLHHAKVYVAEQFSLKMSPAQAMAHFTARTILGRAAAQVMEEVELQYLGRKPSLAELARVEARS